MRDYLDMIAEEPAYPWTVSAIVTYSPLPGTPMMRLGVAVSDWEAPRVADIATRATYSSTMGTPFLVALTVFEGDPHPHRWAGHEIHSRHTVIRTDTVHALATALNALDVPRHAARALPGLEDWADEPSWKAQLDPSVADRGGDACCAGLLVEGWWVCVLTASASTFDLSAPVVRRRVNPETEAPEQLGVVTVNVTLG